LKVYLNEQWFLCCFMSLSICSMTSCNMKQQAVYKEDCFYIIMKWHRTTSPVTQQSVASYKYP
jgi:hypothetical protein